MDPLVWICLSMGSWGSLLGPPAGKFMMNPQNVPKRIQMDPKVANLATSIHFFARVVGFVRSKYDRFDIVRCSRMSVCVRVFFDVFSIRYLATSWQTMYYINGSKWGCSLCRLTSRNGCRGFVVLVSPWLVTWHNWKHSSIERKWGRRTFSPITSPWERNTKRTNLPFADPRDIKTNNKSNMGLKHSQTLCLYMSDPKKKIPILYQNLTIVNPKITQSK